MAIAATVVRKDTRGSKHAVLVDFALTGSYSTGGEVVTPGNVGLANAIESIEPLGAPAEDDETGAWVVVIEPGAVAGNQNVVLFESAGAGLVNTQKPAEAYESASGFRAWVVGH